MDGQSEVDLLLNKLRKNYSIDPIWGSMEYHSLTKDDLSIIGRCFPLGQPMGGIVHMGKIGGMQTTIDLRDPENPHIRVVSRARGNEEIRDFMAIALDKANINDRTTGLFNNAVTGNEKITVTSRAHEQFTRVGEFAANPELRGALNAVNKFAKYIMAEKPSVGFFCGIS